MSTIAPAQAQICAGVTEDSQHMKTSAFMQLHAELPAVTARSGFCPLLQDFNNTSFFLGSCQAAA